MRKNIKHPPDAPIPPLGHSMFPQKESKPCLVRIDDSVMDATFAPSIPFCYMYKRDNESKNP